MPENSGRIVRLEAAGHVAASLPPNTTSNRVKSSYLGSILNQGALADPSITRAEDPHEFAFTDSINFIDGPFTVFPGIEDDSVFILQHLLNAIFFHRHQLQNQDYLRTAFELAYSVLRLSDEIARRAGLSSRLDPVYAPDHDVVIPKNNQLQLLKKAVVFSKSELDELFLSKGIDSSCLNCLTIDLGSVDLDLVQLHQGQLNQSPIIKKGDQYIVTLPSRLLSALRHELINRALGANLREDIVARYTHVVWLTVLESLSYLNIVPASLQVDDFPRVPDIAEGIFQVDTDKGLYVILATDALLDYDRSRTFGTWNTAGLQERIESAAETAISRLLYSADAPNDILILVLIQRSGRSYELRLRRPEWLPFLSLGAADLHTIAQLEGGNKLMLWKYAQASERIRHRVEIIRASVLDEFFLYRKKGYSYYISDEQKHNFITLLPGYAGELREQLRAERDWHWVRSYKGGPVVPLLNVTLLYSDSKIPIYITKDCLFEGAVDILVEQLPVPVWITNAPYKSEADANAREIYARITEAIGYWLWQFTPAIRQPLSPLTRRYRRILIEVRLEEPTSWETHPDECNGGPPITSQVDIIEGNIRLIFNPAMNFLLQGADNTGEREMMRQLLREVASLLPSDQAGFLSERAIETILDRHAPVGVKKKILLFDANSVPELVPDGLPPYRALQRADENELLDELAVHLGTNEGLGVGPIPNNRRTSLLQKVVGFFYGELQQLVATLQPEGLLEWLVSRQEAAIREQVFHQLTIPTRLACFSSEGEMIEQLKRETPRYNLTVAASRFVIEYVTAQPPRGLRPMSMSVYDRLQALASQIIAWGSESDLMHFKLVDHPLQILPSGRLGADRTQYENAQSEYVPTVMFGDIRRSTRAFEALWDESRGNGESDPGLAALNAAALAEFGFSMSEQLDFVIATIRLGHDVNPGVARLSKAEFVRRLSAALKKPEGYLEKMLRMLSLNPRDDFLKPGSDFRSEDVYPWRHNRELSYLRRPFLIRTAEPGEVEVLWGVRHLESFWKYMVGLCTQGRLKAKTPEMIRFSSDLNRERGRRFNKTVAEIFPQSNDLIVRMGVKKFGSLRLSDDEGDPGDIDVLVVDRRRKRVSLVECKDLAQARTPYEMASEITNLFLGSPGKKPIVLLHKRRTDWVREHLTELLDWLKIKPTNGWNAKSLIVVDRELFTPYLKDSPIPIVAIEKLRDEVTKSRGN